MDGWPICFVKLLHCRVLTTKGICVVIVGTSCRPIDFCSRCYGSRWCTIRMDVSWGVDHCPAIPIDIDGIIIGRLLKGYAVCVEGSIRVSPSPHCTYKADRDESGDSSQYNEGYGESWQFTALFSFPFSRSFLEKTRRTSSWWIGTWRRRRRIWWWFWW